MRPAFFAEKLGAPHLCCFHGSALFSGLQFSSPGAGGTVTGKMEGFRAHQDGMGQTDCPGDICIFFKKKRSMFFLHTYLPKKKRLPKQTS